MGKHFFVSLLPIGYTPTHIVPFWRERTILPYYESDGNSTGNLHTIPHHSSNNAALDTASGAIPH